MLVIFDNCRQPHFNLATEEFLLRESSFDQPVMRIWQNSPAVIVGRFQNTLAEIDHDFIKANEIDIVRRITGGGAVYHDLGNINYTIVQKAMARKIDFETFTRPIIKLLAQYGIKAELSGRNDIEIDGKKISGSAQTIVQGRILHHGTLLFSSDLEMLGKALKPKGGKLASKGVRSVGARVGNIAGYLTEKLTADNFMEDIYRFFIQQPGNSAHSLSFRDFKKIETLTDIKYRQWVWNFGQSPQFNLERSHRYEWGEVTFLLLVTGGLIESIKVYGDFFTPHEVDEAFAQLVGTPFETAVLAEKIGLFQLWTTLPGMTREELYKQLLP